MLIAADTERTAAFELYSRHGIASIPNGNSSWTNHGANAHSKAIARRAPARSPTMRHQRGPDGAIRRAL
jgi:hypothetical protein